MNYRKYIQRIYQPIAVAPGMFYRAVLQSSLWSLFEVYTIILVMRITDAIALGKVEVILTYAWIYLISLALFQVAKYFMRQRGRGEMTPTIGLRMRDIYFPQYTQKSISHVEKMGTGRVLSIIKGAIDAWQEMILNLAYIIPKLIINIGFALYLIWQLGWIYAVIFLVTIVGINLITKQIDSYAIKWRKLRKDTAVLLERQFVRMLMSKQEIMQHDKTSYELGTMRNIGKEVQGYNLRVNNNLWKIFSMPGALMSLLSAATFFYAYWGQTHQTFSLPFFVGLTTLIGYMTSTVMSFAELFKQTTQNLIHIEKMREFLDTTPDMKNFSEGASFELVHGNVEFQNVSFCYEEEAVLQDFSLSISGGEKTALVGVSGSGKSTLIKMIAGYISPDAGKISVDQQDLQSIALKTYYPHVGYLSQEPNIFDGTIYENLVYALDTLPDESSIHKAIEQSQCQFIYEFAAGLQTEIGEKGIRLSGGQRQRLAIAKIFLKNPKIILLDEPTSALDSFSEEKISNALKELFTDRTVIIIAHRLQTVKEADTIMVIEGGKVIECGNHDELVGLGGQYATMLKLQSGF